MRQRPYLAIAVVVVFLAAFYGIVEKPARDVLGLRVHARLSELRPPPRGERPTDRDRPGIAPEVRAYLRREMDIAGRADGGRVARFEDAGKRSALVVARGRRHGLRPGDLAVIPTERGDQLVLIGDVTDLTDDFARVRTLLDEKAWWLAATDATRFAVVGAGGGHLAVRVPERKSLLADDVAVTTADDFRPGRPVPAGLLIGRLRRNDDGRGFRVRLERAPGGVLAVRFLRDGRLLPLERVGGPGTDGTWAPVTVRQPVDASALRHAAVVRAVGDAPVPIDAPVALGPFLDGWAHTVHGRTARVRLVGDPGFYAQVLVLRPSSGGLTRVGSTVYRGRGRADARGTLHGRLRPFEAEVKRGDRIVVGPHKGTGGVGLLVGEVVHWRPDGAVRLRRTVRVARGDRLWVGTFARPPARFDPR